MCGDELIFKGMIGELYWLCVFVLDYYLILFRIEESIYECGGVLCMKFLFICCGYLEVFFWV